jgi:hypothetical protein
MRTACRRSLPDEPEMRVDFDSLANLASQQAPRRLVELVT